MKLNLKKSQLLNLSHDNQVLPNDLTPQDKVLPNELTPQVGGGAGTYQTVGCMSFQDCTTVNTCKQY